MKVKVNIQSENEVIIETVKNNHEFNMLISNSLRQWGHKTYLVMTGKNPKTDTPVEWFVTSSPTDIDLWFENVNMNQKIYIQVFEYHDFAAIIDYLKIMYEYEDNIPIEDITINLN
jgi:leucyl aminopeptidase (aminopeptidase T)